ncbi:Eukaryotic and archaeal DNA primase, large subunit [uncultured archaeon]|nr:Eukaryotic and archaeal DNA primase, large subunit [uncultured archaeon]
METSPSIRDDKQEVSRSFVKSEREERIRKITKVYYSKPEIQKAIFNFSINREVVPRYFEGFGKRPDCLQYESDIFELVKKGATSFHCSEEIWDNPLNIQTGMTEKQLNGLRTGWDLILDIDSKYIDYSKIMAKIIINFLEFSGVRNVGVKFSGSKGFHMIIPWKAFPKEINGVKTSDMFPEWARIITKYIMAKTHDYLITEITKLYSPNKYIKDREAPKEVMPDLILVSPRHLFRMPYSLHEKTALASVVIDKSKISDFQPTDANPLKAEIKNFIPNCKEGEATRLLMQALDWNRENAPKEEKKNFEYKPIQITDRSEKNFPPCIKKILLGVQDGKKRALFALINFFRSAGTEKDELEKILYSWNERNQPPLHQGYIKTQISWALKRKPIMPPNCMEFYQGVGVCSPDELCRRIKNPVNYLVRKNFQSNRKQLPKNKDNFKNNN